MQNSRNLQLGQELNENTNIQLVTSGNTMKEKQLEPMKEDSENNGWGVEGCCTQLQVQ